MKTFKKILIGLVLFALPLIAFAQFTTQQGGTGTTTPSGILYGNNTLHLQTVTIGSGCTFTTGTLACAGTGGAGSFPFTSVIGYNSTSTTLGFLNGFFSTASSTISGPFHLNALSNGGLAVFGGLVSSGATTTAGTGLTYTSNAFNVNTSQNITNLTNLNTAGNVITTGTGGALSIDTTAYTPQTRTITVAGTANQLTSSAGSQDLSANRTWTLSFPNQVIFPQYASSTLGFSTVYASSTFGFFGTVNIATTTAGCASITSGGNVFSTGVACGSGSGGSGTVTSITPGTGLNSSPNPITTSGTISLRSYLATSTAETNSQVAYFTSTNGTPATLSSVATSSLAIGSSLSNSGTLGFQIGGSASSLSLNTANTNTWSVLQNFNFSSSTSYASFQNASSTNWLGGGLTTCSGSNFLQYSASGFFGCATPSGSGSVSSGLAGQLGYYNVSGSTIVGTSTNPLYVDAIVATSTTIANTFASTVGVATTTPYGTLSINAAAQTNPYFSIGSSTSQVFSIAPSLSGSGTLTISTTTAGCSAFSVTGLLYSTGAPCGSSTGITSFIAGAGLLGGTITNGQTVTSQISTSSIPTLGGIAYWTGLGTASVPAKLDSVATTSLAVGASLSSSGTLGSQIGGSATSLSINTANTNTWSILQNFNYSSTSLYASFLNASSTFGFFGTLNIATTTAGCASITSGGNLFSTGVACGTSGGSGTVTNIAGGINIHGGPITTTGTLTANSAATLTVSTSTTSGDYTTVQSAINALPATGGLIHVTCGTYTLPTANVGIQPKVSNTIIEGEGVCTEFNFDMANTNEGYDPAVSNLTGLVLRDVYFHQTNATQGGLGVVASNTPLFIASNIKIDGTATATPLKDTKNLTFYQNWTNIDARDNKSCLDIGGLPVNDNVFTNYRCATHSGSGGFALYLDSSSVNGAQNNTFINFDSEPTGAATGLAAIYANNAVDDTFINPYVEGNAVGWKLTANSQRITFQGGEFVTNTTYTNLGSNNQWLGTDKEGVAYQIIQASSTIADVSGNDATAPSLSFIGNSNFAKTAPVLQINLNNSTDSGAGIKITNPGTGPSISVVSGNSAFGTSSAQFLVNPFSTTLPQLGLSFGAGTSQWTFRNSGGILYVATTSPTSTATSTTAALTIDANGKVIANCFSTNGSTCIGGSGTVTSVTLATPSSTLTLGGTNPVITSGTINADVNLAHTNTWSVLQNFNYSSTSLYASFLNASSTNLFAGSFTLATTTAGCASITSGGSLFSTGVACGSGGGSGTVGSGTIGQFPYYAGSGTTLTATSSLFVSTAGFLGIGTTTPVFPLTIANTTKAQLSLQANVGEAPWFFRSIGGNLYIGTSSPTTFATSTQSALSLTGTGAPFWGIGTSSPFAILSVVNTSGSPTPLFAVASSTLTGASMPVFEIDSNGHQVTSGPPPVISSCGTSPTVVGNDSAGIISTSGTVTSCTMTFATAYKTTPSCTTDDSSTGSTADIVSQSASAVTFGFSVSLGTGFIDYQCVGTQ